MLFDSWFLPAIHRCKTNKKGERTTENLWKEDVTLNLADEEFVDLGCLGIAMLDRSNTDKERKPTNLRAMSCRVDSRWCQQHCRVDKLTIILAGGYPVSNSFWAGYFRAELSYRLRSEGNRTSRRSAVIKILWLCVVVLCCTICETPLSSAHHRNFFPPSLPVFLPQYGWKSWEKLIITLHGNMFWSFVHVTVDALVM